MIITERPTSYSRKRVSELARPKQVSPGHIPNRRSIYWVDEQPAQRPKSLDKVPKRICALSRSRPSPVGHIPDRPTPIWAVSKGATKFAVADPYMVKLSRPKQYHNDYVAANYSFVRVKPGATRCTTSQRTQRLSAPKRKTAKVEEGVPVVDEAISQVSPGALRHEASGRLSTLATPKRIFRAKGGQLIRSPLWPVSTSATTIVASKRQEQLAKPKLRLELDHDYDPFKVTAAAKNAVASARVGVLCLPLLRKSSHKK